MSLSDNNVTFTHFDTTDYSNSNNANGNYLSGKSKVAFYAAVPTNENVYRMRIEFPNTTSYETGHSRNLLSFTGNTKAVGSGIYEWHKDGTGSISTTTDNPSGNSETTGTKTLFTFGPLSSSTGCEFSTNIRQYIKARHTDFRFTAWVKGESGNIFNINIMAFGFSVDETLSITTTNQWQYINIPLSGADKSTVDFIIAVSLASGSTGTLQMIEPMLAVDGAFSNTYTWCPNAYDNYRNWPSDADVWTNNAYNTETRTAYLDGIDNTFTPKIGNTSASGLYGITVHIDYFGSTDRKYDDTFDVVPRIDVSAYDVPHITNGTSDVYRSNSSGVIDTGGDYFSCEAEILAFPINISSPKSTSFRVRYRPYGSTNEMTVAGTSNIASTTAQTLKITSSSTISGDTSYEAVLEYKDFYMSDYATLNTFIVPSSFALIDYHYSGKGISFGRVATNEIVEQCEDGGIDMNLPIYYSDSAFNATNDASIDQMIKQISVSAVSTLPTGVSSIGTFQVIRCGQIVTVQLEFALSATLSSWTAIVSSGMPAPFGTTTVITTAGNWGTTVLRGCRVSVGTSGNLQLRYGEAGTYRAQFTYITKDPLSTVS